MSRVQPGVHRLDIKDEEALTELTRRAGGHMPLWVKEALFAAGWDIKTLAKCEADAKSA